MGLQGGVLVVGHLFLEWWYACTYGGCRMMMLAVQSVNGCRSSHANTARSSDKCRDLQMFIATLAVLCIVLAWDYNDTLRLHLSWLGLSWSLWGLKWAVRRYYSPKQLQPKGKIHNAANRVQRATNCVLLGGRFTLFLTLFHDPTNSHSTAFWEQRKAAEGLAMIPLVKGCRTRSKILVWLFYSAWAAARNTVSCMVAVETLSILEGIDFQGLNHPCKKLMIFIEPLCNPMCTCWRLSILNI